MVNDEKEKTQKEQDINIDDDDEIYKDPNLLLKEQDGLKILDAITLHVVSKSYSKNKLRSNTNGSWPNVKSAPGSFQKFVDTVYNKYLNTIAIAGVIVYNTIR
uniref:Uncharacterized protein n=1 Tax=Rhizophagus irregularis (strain DAOM 181602 / DAOM 197198 / MUCL 43194) TaxID=747089 RepID=U9TWW7_RHIID